MNLIHAGFLAAGLAVAVPIVIHLLFRQRTRTVPIGSVRFLHQVVREHRRRRRLRQWVLLSLRMLAVLLLALLFARPYWDRSHLLGLEQEVVVLVDRSASMLARDSSGETAFQRAIAAARLELSQLDTNVIVHVAACDSTGILEIPIKDLSTLDPSEAATDFGLALSWARDVLSNSNRKGRRIVLVTDLQRSGLPRTPFERLPDDIELVIRDVGDPLPRNVAIESAEAMRTEIRPDSQVSVRAVIRNSGALAVRNLPVKCDLADRSNESFRVQKTIDIPGRGSAVVDFPLAIVKDGLYKGHVTIEIDDAIVLDNQRWIAFEARHPDRILLVDGQEGRSVFNGETYFLETALRLQTEEPGGGIRSFEPDRIVWEAGEGFPRLDGYRAVVLANVRRLSAVDGQRIGAYVRDGGSLLIFAGDQVGSNSLAVLEEEKLLPGKIADAPIEGQFRVDRWDQKHPTFACFNDPQQGDLRRIEFQRLLPLKSVEPETRALLSSGDRVIAAEISIGKGRCLYFGSTADREWTELPRTPMYVPLMRQLMAYLTDQLSERSLVTSVLVSKMNPKSGITLEELDHERSSKAPFVNGAAAPRKPPVAGPVEENEGRWIVTNVDPRESALERITDEQLHELAGGAPMDKSKDKSSESGLTLPADSLRPDEFWMNIAWLLLAVLAAETLLAGRVHA